MQLHINNVRFSYLYCHEPYVPKDPKQKPSYCVHGLMTPDHPDLPKVLATIEQVGLEKWKDKWTSGMGVGDDGKPQGMKDILKLNDKFCLHRGDRSKAGQPEYAGLFYISASNKRQFTVVGPDRGILTAKDNLPFSGCWGNLIVDIWAQDNEFGKRVNATALGVQHVRIDSSFGGGAAPASPDEFSVQAQAADSAPPGAASAAGLI